MADGPVRRRLQCFPVVSKLSRHGAKVELETETAELLDAEDHTERLLWGVRQAVAAVQFVISEFGDGQIHVPEVGV